MKLLKTVSFNSTSDKAAGKAEIDCMPDASSGIQNTQDGIGIVAGWLLAQ